MLRYARQFSIRQRFYLILALVVIGLLIISYLAYTKAETNLLEGKRQSLSHVVEAAHYQVQYFQEQAQAGALTRAEAQQQAMTALRAIRFDGDQYLWLIDTQPTMLMHPINPALDGQDVSQYQDKLGNLMFQDMVAVVRAEGQGFLRYYWPRPGVEEPVAKLSYVREFSPWGWIVGAGMYIDDINAELQSQMILFLEIVIAISLVLLGLMLLISKSIVAAVKDVVLRMRDIASGDGDLRVHLPEAGNDELTALSRHFNQFVDKMRRVIQELVTSVGELDALSQQLSSDAQSAGTAMDRQQHETQQVVSAMQQMSATARDIAQNAEQAFASARDATQQASQGRDIARKTVASINHLAQAMADSAEAMKRLQADSDDIGGVLTVIEGVAEQTNLLALNAAIEAARAGEQGRGFSVVADEVRALASKAQDSTTDIKEMIAKLQSGAGSAAAAIQTNLGQSEQSVQDAHHADTVLEGIAEAISRISDMNTQIASASEEQSLVVEEINRNVTAIGEMTDTNSATAASVRDASQHLRNVVTTLRARTDEFKV